MTIRTTTKLATYVIAILHGCDRFGGRSRDSASDGASVVAADNPALRDVYIDRPTTSDVTAPPFDPRVVDGSVRLQSQVTDDRRWPPTSCPGARFVGANAIWEERRMCRIGSTFVMPGLTTTFFYNPTTRNDILVGEIYQDSPQTASGYCAGSRFLAMITLRPPWAPWSGIVSFDDPLGVGRVLWTLPLPPGANYVGGGRLVSTDRVMAWIWVGADERSSVWVGRPDGTHIRQISRLEGAEPTGTYFHADGGRVVWMNGYLQIAMYDTDTDQVTMLTDFPGGREMPWIQGDRVVFMETDANTQVENIVLYDIRTRQRRTITRATEVHRYFTNSPIIYNDWVIWVDLRDSQNPAGPFAERGDLYGFNLRTNREYHLFGGPNISTDAPQVFDNQIYFSCTDDRTLSFSGFAIPLPDVSGDLDAGVPANDGSADAQ